MCTLSCTADQADGLNTNQAISMYLKQANSCQDSSNKHAMAYLAAPVLHTKQNLSFWCHAPPYRHPGVLLNLHQHLLMVVTVDQAACVVPVAFL